MEFNTIEDALSYAKSLVARFGGAFVAYGYQSFRDCGDYEFHFVASRYGSYTKMAETYPVTAANWVR